MTAPLRVDLTIIGSGFGGSLLAMIARRLGMRVALLERGAHPRFAIGESASPLAGVVIEQLARRYDLPRLAPLAAYGAWRRSYPHVTCGLKRGFTYFKHVAGRRFERCSRRSTELLVAASPDDERSDTHWLRADVDQFLMQEAVAAGVEYMDRVDLTGIECRAGDVRLSATRRGAALELATGFVVDAGGPRGYLSKTLGLEASGFDGYPPTQALYSHFTGVARCADLPEFADDEKPPYPIDAAALHHVFDGGWMWVLRFDNGVTSAGVAVTEALAAQLHLADGEAAWDRLLARYPTVASQFADARPVREFTWMPQVSWRCSPAAGERWALLPSAGAFVDPLFSTGIPMTLLGVERLARRLAKGYTASNPARAADETGVAGDLLSDARRTLAEADHVARFVAGCYDAFPSFEQFTAWSMCYFAAASFSEMSRRLHGDEWSRGFLLADDERFAGALRRWSPSAAVNGGDHQAYARRIAAEIDRVNVAGLADPVKRNWYGVDVEDAVRAAAKLDAEPAAIRAIFDCPL